MDGIKLTFHADDVKHQTLANSFPWNCVYQARDWRKFLRTFLKLLNKEHGGKVMFGTCDKFSSRNINVALYIYTQQFKLHVNQVWRQNKAGRTGQSTWRQACFNHRFSRWLLKNPWAGLKHELKTCGQFFLPDLLTIWFGRSLKSISIFIMMLWWFPRCKNAWTGYIWSSKTSHSTLNHVFWCNLCNEIKRYYSFSMGSFFLQSTVQKMVMRWAARYLALWHLFIVFHGFVPYLPLWKLSFRQNH